MKNRRLIFGLVFIIHYLLFNINSSAQVFITKTSKVTFFSESAMENIDATSENVQSIINAPQKTVAFIIPIRSFKFESDLMQEHFNEKYMESDKYPTATFSGKVNEDVDLTKNGCYRVTATGKMKMHGVEKDMTYSGTATVTDGQISLDSELPVAIKDFKIEIPKLLFQNIADTVAVKMNVIYQPFKKQ